MTSAALHDSTGEFFDASDGIVEGVARADSAGHYSTEQQIEDELSGLPPDVVKWHLDRMVTDEMARKAVAAARQRRIAEANARIEFAANEHLAGCRLVAEVSREAFDFWLSEKEVLGDNPWSHEEFWDEFIRDNEEARVKEVSRRCLITSGWDAERSVA